MVFWRSKSLVWPCWPGRLLGPSDFSHLGPKIELLSPVPILQCNQLRRTTTTTRAICQSYYCIVHIAPVLHAGAADSRWDMADTIIAGHWFGPALSSILTPWAHRAGSLVGLLPLCGGRADKGRGSGNVLGPNKRDDKGGRSIINKKALSLFFTLVLRLH